MNQRRELDKDLNCPVFAVTKQVKGLLNVGQRKSMGQQG